ncbi:PREDICTED: uncharacterized protein LOC106109023 [Papilio polytes]|uniref:uncharacterized protein LOC106109023 n=1 Tax=Papilio polytes TaxID=76194 RepID=UPI0006765234|nr:PREDICTED: uncharacterized protein LOC106109023 [Papilio polytes]
MDQQFQLLFEEMKIEMQRQTIELRESITNSIMDRMDEKLTPIIAENKKLKQKINTLEKEVEYLKREKKGNNLVIFGIEEGEKSISELFDNFKKILKDNINIDLQQREINKLYRLGKNKIAHKPRPILCSFINKWKKEEILKNKRNLKEIHVSEDYTKEVLEKRKALMPKLNEEKKKGNIAFIKYDQLIVIEQNTNADKRKRELSTSPQLPSKIHTKKHQMPSSLKSNRSNAFDIMRSHSLTNISNNSKQ